MRGLAWAQTLCFNVSAGDGRRDRSAGERFRENREIPDHKACPVSVCRVTNLIAGIGIGTGGCTHCIDRNGRHWARVPI